MLVPWKESYDQPRQHFIKQRHHFAKKKKKRKKERKKKKRKGHIVKAMVFPVVNYRCESWTLKKSEHQRIDAFKLWCWRRPLRVPWTAWRSNQSILKEINPEHSLEGLMLKLKLQYFGHMMQRVNSLWKRSWERLKEGRERGDRGWDGWMASRTQWTWVWANFGW